MNPSAQRLSVSHVQAEGRDAILLGFAIPPALQARFAFQPGQYLTLAVPVAADDAPWRCYSITSEPVAGAPIEVLVRRVAGGRVSNWLCDHARPGLALDVLPPAGRFTLARPGEPVLLVAGGSGIAPLYALAREALQQRAPRVRLFYANRDRGTAMLVGALQALQQAYGERLDIRAWHDAEQGLPTGAALAEQLRGYESADAYLCGPEPFMRSVDAALRASGFDSARLRREDYGAAVEAPAGSGGETAQLTVTLKGQTHVLPVAAGESLLAAMLRAGLPAPHACRVGECASCMCRLQEGEVQRLDNSVLDEQDIAGGWLLACRTLAASPELRLRFS